MAKLFLGTREMTPAVLGTDNRSKCGLTIDDFIGDLSSDGTLSDATSTTSLDFTGVKTLNNEALEGRFYRRDGIQSVSFPDLEVIGPNGLHDTFWNITSLRSVSFPKLREIGSSGLNCAFYASLQSNYFPINIDLSKIETIPDEGCRRTFSGSSGLNSVDLSSVTTVGHNGCYEMFYQCFKLTSADISSIETIGTYGCFNMFYQCTSLTSFTLPAGLTTIPQTGMYGMFSNCTSLTTVDASHITTISGTQALSNLFYACSNLTNVSFTRLTNLYNTSNTFQSALASCPKLTSVSFPALTTSSIVNSGEFMNMFSYNTGSQATGGCVVHFPSNLQSTIQALTYYPTFGGSSAYISIAFDLPATS